MKGYSHPKKNATPTLMEFRTTSGYRVLCGKNNLQNEYLTHKLARKTDYWFHAKNRPGSHAVLFCEGEEPDARDFTDAAEIAARLSTIPYEVLTALSPRLARIEKRSLL